jgi:hypothetical protein
VSENINQSNSKKLAMRRMTMGERLLGLFVGCVLIVIGTCIGLSSLVFDVGGFTAGHGFRDSGLLGWIGAIPSSLGLIFICISIFDWSKSTPQIIEDTKENDQIKEVTS